MWGVKTDVHVKSSLVFYLTGVDAEKSTKLLVEWYVSRLYACDLGSQRNHQCVDIIGCILE